MAVWVAHGSGTGRSNQLRFDGHGDLHMLSMDIPPWVLHTIDKIRRSFLWRGMEDVKAGHCKVAWGMVCRPKELGGLGIHNLRYLNAALRVHWSWLARTDPERPWQGLHVHITTEAASMFTSSTACTVGNGRVAVFWVDRWIEGASVMEIAPGIGRPLGSPGGMCGGRGAKARQMD